MRKRNTTIAIRCTEEESRRIHELAERHGLKLNDFVMRSALGKKIVVANGINEIVKQQKAIGRNLNQIAMLAHEGRLHSVRLDELVEQHRSVTAAVCEIAKVVK
ncbi:plasmid mobilization protein [Ruminococcus flavefaciens]|uniref:Mobilization protein MobC n=1 Tax=Ruminococcus flavefaciens TaxID=1265 RepID=A0A315XU51_RUMFL|nr:plasmid mobilization relaxosome protein MobC [Ruminococcus flavefaciens]PWJ09618.1 mobilization protein MobC [Ruminococcus flavefaciens]SSA52319.1 mobilisation protein (MobC) [Ruminococcus flavefaciens]